MEMEKPTATVDIDEAGRRYLEEAKRKDALARWKYHCPPELQETDFDHPNLKPYRKLHDEILAWQWGKKGVLASGPTGRGKTRSMWQLMRKLAEEGRDIRYFTATDFFADMQAQTAFGRDNCAAWCRAFAGVPIVFIDDLGQEAVMASKEDYVRALFFQFLDIRLGNGLPLFVTTNLTAAQMAERTTEVRANPMVRRLLDLATPVRFV